jgi:hypothetical protein
MKDERRSIVQRMWPHSPADYCAGRPEGGQRNSGKEQGVLRTRDEKDMVKVGDKVDITWNTDVTVSVQ